MHMQSAYCLHAWDIDNTKHNAFMLLPKRQKAFLALAANQHPAAAVHATFAFKSCFAKPAYALMFPNNVGQ